jgi:hypothetical protein
VLNIKKLYQIHRIEARQDVILAMDSLSIRPYIKVDKDGHVSGLSGRDEVDPRFADALVDDSVRALEFFHKGRTNAIKAAFVILYLSTGGFGLSFPVRIIEVNDGSAMTDICRKRQKFGTFMNELGFDVVGTALDGDREYLEDVSFYLASVRIYTLMRILPQNWLNCFTILKELSGSRTPFICERPIAIGSSVD